MVIQRLYYALKPYLPWGVRMGLRRITARRKRRACQSSWPIDAAAGSVPVGWPGWPGGKRFAFVATHDVEGPAGLAKCRQLAELEMSLGIRSSFNFIPEGTYAVPDELRSWLAEHDFEVGVHDLQHDGKLFSSRQGFKAKAVRINSYLRKWGVPGFRAGFMLGNPGWLHDLDIRYDSSTFDTDPFELQPNAVQTIFPFWVPAPTRPDPVSPPDCDARPPKGYVELPYTLPQDSTLFLVLQEASPEIWKRKLDWIAEKGGMALVNVHPDYMRFENERTSNRTYHSGFYRELLEYVKTKYAGQYWQPLPREVAAYAAPFLPLSPSRRRKRVCMVTHSFYESDNRVTRYAEALVQRGDQVDVLSLRRSANQPSEETIEGVRVFRIQDRFGKTEKSAASYLWPLLRFLAVSSWQLTRRHARERYDLVHIHNIPDFLVFAAWYPKLTGTPVILDIHDIVPEFFASKFGKNSGGAFFRMLKWMERASASMADHVIIANHLWLESYTTRTRTADRCTAFINYVDSRVFVPQVRDPGRQKKIIIFPGGLQWHQGLDIALRAFAKVIAELPDTEFHIYGDGNAKDSLVALTRELNLNGHVQFFEPTSVRQIATIMARADLGVVPKRADSFGNEAYSTKIMEFMSAGVPVVVSSTKIDRYYFDDSVVRFFESGNVDALAREMVVLLRSESIREAQVRRAIAYVARNCWDRRKQDYLGLVDQLCPFC